VTLSFSLIYNLIGRAKMVDLNSHKAALIRAGIFLSISVNQRQFWVRRFT